MIADQLGLGALSPVKRGSDLSHFHVLLKISSFGGNRFPGDAVDIKTHQHVG